MSKRTPSFRVPLILRIWSKGMHKDQYQRTYSRAEPEEIPLPEVADIQRTYETYELTPKRGTESPTEQEQGEEPHRVEAGKSCMSRKSRVSCMSATKPSATKAEQENGPPLYLFDVWESAMQKPMPPEADRYVMKLMKRLVAFCHELQFHSRTGTFFLTCRDAAHFLGTNYQQANRWMLVLETDGILDRIGTGKYKGKSNVYRYVGYVGGIAGVD